MGVGNHEVFQCKTAAFGLGLGFRGLGGSGFRVGV